MVDGGNGLSRRRVLALAAGVAATGGAVVGSTVAAADSTEKIVGIEPGGDPDPPKSKADEVRGELDFGGAGKAVVGTYSDSNDLQDNVDVSYVENNGEARVPSHVSDDVESPDQCLPWGVDRVDADVAHAEGETGTGADVAIVDTGIDDDHPDVGPNVGSGAYAVKCTGPGCNHKWSDDHGHGTHTAGTVAGVDDDEGVVGVAPDATLHSVKVLDANGSGTWADVAAGIAHVADQGWDVALLSLGSSSASETIRNACEYAHEQGVLLVAAAGNDGPCEDCVKYPAAFPEVLGVSATDGTDDLAGASSTGPGVDLAAPGTGVYSSVIGGYDAFSGTSMAAPHVAAAAGQLMAQGASSVEARDALTGSAEDLGLGSDQQGAGLLDVAATLGYGSDDDGTGTC